MTQETKEVDLDGVREMLAQAVGETIKGGPIGGPIATPDGFGSCVARASARGVAAGLTGRKLDTWVGTFINVCHALYD